MKILNVQLNNFQTYKKAEKSLKPKQNVSSYDLSQKSSNPAVYKNNLLSFGTLCRLNERSLSEETSFFRDIDTLDCSVDVLKENFPNGASILDFACSDGEESLSLLALLGDDRTKYDIKAYDISDTLVQRAKEGKYDVFDGLSDEFLLYNSPNSFSPFKQLLCAFYEIMQEDNSKPLDGRCHNAVTPHGLRYIEPFCCSVKDEFKDMIEFDTLSIENIDKLNPKKPVGAVFFRNAFYHLFRPKGEYGFGFREMTGKEKAEKAEEIIDKIDSVLAPGGIFVMGDAHLEHVFKADETIPDADRVRFCDIYENASPTVPYIKNNDYIFKKSPIVKALRDKGYKRLHITKVSIGMDFDRFMPIKINAGTVWQKPKN